MISILVSGNLIKKPERRTASNGNPYAVAQARVANGTDSVLVSLVAFDEGICRALLALDKGDDVCASGPGKPTTWTNREGEACFGLKVEQLLSQYSLSKKRAAARGEQPQYSLPTGRPLDRELDSDGTAPF